MSLSLATRAEPAQKSLTKTATPWNVIVHDDPVNLMDYVTLILQRVFGYSVEKSKRMMLEVHQNGKSLVWTGDREKAELYVAQLHGFQLKATLEKQS